MSGSAATLASFGGALTPTDTTWQKGAGSSLSVTVTSTVTSTS
jgi:hypothetical protein